MQKIMWVVLILVVVLIGFNMLSSKKEEVNNNTDIKNEEVLVVEIPANGVKIDPLKSQLKWEGKKTLIASWVDAGDISLKNGYVVFENNLPVRGEALIDMTTIKATKTGKGAGEDMLTKHLSSDDFFAVETYPTAKITIESMTKDAVKANTYKAMGTLTIRNISNPIEFEVVENSPKNLTGAVSVDRSKYDVKFGSGKFFSNLGDNIIDDIFTVSFNLVLE